MVTKRKYKVESKCFLKVKIKEIIKSYEKMEENLLWKIMSGERMTHLILSGMKSK